MRTSIRFDDEGLHKKARMKCIKSGISFNGYVISLIERDLHVELVPAAKKIKVGKPTVKKVDKVEDVLSNFKSKPEIKIPVVEVKNELTPYDKLPPRMKQLIKYPDEYNKKAEVVTDRTV